MQARSNRSPARGHRCIVPRSCSARRAIPMGRRSRDPPERPLAWEDRLFITLGGWPQFVQVCEIVCITAEDDYSALHLRDGRKGLVLTPLSNWAARSPDQHFVRVHRSAIVQFGSVTRIGSWFSGSYLLHLAGRAEPVTMSRHYATVLKGRLRWADESRSRQPLASLPTRSRRHSCLLLVRHGAFVHIPSARWHYLRGGEE